MVDTVYIWINESLWNSVNFHSQWFKLRVCLSFYRASWQINVSSVSCYFNVFIFIIINNNKILCIKNYKSEFLLHFNIFLGRKQITRVLWSASAVKRLFLALQIQSLPKIVTTRKKIAKAANAFMQQKL